MKSFTIPALLIGVAQAIVFLNDIPVDAYYDVGTDFVLEWEPEDTTDTFQLTISTFLKDPILVNPDQSSFPIYDYKDIKVVLDEAVSFSDGSFTWPIETVDGRTGEEYWYSFGVEYGTTYEIPRSFHVQ
ncbi:hypothetical protein GGR53DRAFT_144779 [Hypoxylon sp. FL1150]|nr:hypothetical protein GGR53DRAFT_144779 [Hypoxylon sp. FL1150]